jgi:hypothetical protein
VEQVFNLFIARFTWSASMAKPTRQTKIRRVVFDTLALLDSTAIGSMIVSGPAQ